MGTWGEQPADGPEELLDAADADGVGSYGTSIRGLAKLAGVERSTVQGWTIKEGFPEKLPDGTYNAFEVGRWHFEWKMPKTQRRPAEDDELEDPTKTSPALEILRMNKAIMAGYDVLERRQTIIRRDQVLDWLLEFSHQMREAFETIKKDFGPKAHLILEDALRTALILVEERFGPINDRQPSQDDADRSAVQ